MTLISVANSAKGYRIESDTKITVVKRKGLQREDNETSSIPGILKLFILSENYCLGYAGVYEYGLRALREIVKGGYSQNLEEIKNIIDRVHAESYNVTSYGTDFILCCRSSEITHMWRNSACIDIVHDCFIGDEIAYKAIDPCSTNRRSLHDIVTNEDYEGVGGFVIGVYDNGVSFSYQTVMQVYFQNSDVADSSRNFQCVTVVPKRPEARLGIYIPDIGLGYLYDPVDRDSPEKIYASNMSIFKDRALLVGAMSISIRSAVPTVNRV